MESNQNNKNTAKPSVEKVTWTRTADALPPEGTHVEVITESGDYRRLYYDRLWFLPDRSMYVYFTPLLWRALSLPPALRCDTCSGTGLVDWAPFQQRDSEDDQQPCPDCSRIPSVSEDVR